MDYAAEQERHKNDVMNQPIADAWNFVPGIGTLMDGINIVDGATSGLWGATEREQSDGWAQAWTGAVGLIPGVGELVDFAAFAHNTERANHYAETGETKPSYDETVAQKYWDDNHPAPGMPGGPPFIAASPDDDVCGPYDGYAE